MKFVYGLLILIFSAQSFAGDCTINFLNDSRDFENTFKISAALSGLDVHVHPRDSFEYRFRGAAVDWIFSNDFDNDIKNPLFLMYHLRQEKKNRNQLVYIQTYATQDYKGVDIILLYDPGTCSLEYARRAGPPYELYPDWEDG